MEPIFSYSNYRLYLADYYAWRKAVEPGFSHRLFLTRAGMKGPNFLKNIIDGKVRLSSTGIPKFVKALGLEGDEAEFFHALVMCNQAKTLERRQLWFEKLGRFAERSPVQRLKQDQLAYLRTWYAVAIREYVHSRDWSGDFAELASAIYPAITPGKARQAVELLQKLELIRCEDGKWSVTDRQVSTGAEIEDLAAAKYHESMSEIAATAAMGFARSERYFRGITASFSEETYQTIRSEIMAFADKIVGLIDGDEGVRKVHQINLQLFPLAPPAPMRRAKGRKQS